MNLVIIEDSPIIRTQLLRLVSLQARIRVVGTAGDEAQAVDLILERRPDAVILDLALSPGSGVRVLERIRDAGCGARVVVLTNHASGALQSVCGRLGISGFFDKSREVQACLDLLAGWLPPLPANEAARLRALASTQLLGTPEQEIFDNIARLASTIARTPVALITLVDDDRQWFLSHIGLAQRETSRSVAFCAHAIARDEMMIVEDAAADPRFRDNPLVAGEPHIRFYAGVPLVLPSGEALGTLCVIDRQPRSLDATTREALTTLARSALGEIELRRRIIRLEAEIERRQEAEAHIHHLATRDPLTALPNRSTFGDRLDQQLRQARRNGSRLAVMFVDLDRFKLINDTLGHDVGDGALVIAAERLSRALRECDTVARLGGDEFAVIVSGLAASGDAEPIADKLIHELLAPFVVRGHRLRVDASIGIALFPEHGDTGGSLLRHADLAMYQAKQLGGGRCASFERRLSERAESALALETDLRDAIEADELVVYFQPQAALGDGTVSGMEALVRWRHPHMGLLSPDGFVPLAEARGLIQAIGAIVLDKSLAQLAVWDAAGVAIPRLAVNVSPIELRAGYSDMVAAALARHGVAPERLELEITETALTADGIEVLRTLNDVRARGISVAVDDFGVGYSSLGQIRRLPIDALKIDKSLVKEVHESHAGAAIIRAVVTMANALGLRTIAEGTESESQLLAVQDTGCDCVQGYLLSKPMPAEAVADWMRTFAARSGPWLVPAAVRGIAPGDGAAEAGAGSW